MNSESIIFRFFCGIEVFFAEFKALINNELLRKLDFGPVGVIYTNK